MSGWRGRFDADAEEQAAPAEIGVGRVVECVAFEDTAAMGRAEAAEFADERGDVRDAELDFDFGSYAGAGHK